MPGIVFVLLVQLAGYAPPQAVDHVVHYEIVAGHGSSSGDRTTLYRSGPLIRTSSTSYGQPGGNSYRNLARDLVVSTGRDRDGALLTMTIGRPITRPRRLSATGRQDRALGEVCTISRLSDEYMGSNSEICETADGLLLWQAFWYPHAADRTVMYQRATEIERRPVRPEEVLPPRDLLALASLPPPATPASEPGPDYEVEMVGVGRGEASYLLRRHGPLMSEMRWRSGERWFHVSNGTVSVSYSESDAGGPRSLDIRRIGSPSAARLVSRWEPIAGRRPERVLGETCIWQHDAAIWSTDLNNQCRTADGIALKTEVGGHYGPVRHFTARRLSRRPLGNADFAIPARALQWSHWGITPAP